MKSFISHVLDNVGLYVIIALFSFLFLFHLDYSTLGSWDEAWYGVIAREMMRSGDFLRMKFNSLPFFDHPPAGFWLMTISYKLFGISELSTRLPSALCGIGTIVLIYLTAVKLFEKKSIGFVAAVVMGTCVWYVLRVRSGNLDSTFVFFYILTIYLALKARENIKWFIPTMTSFALLFLTKTLVGGSALLLVLLVNSNYFPTLLHKSGKKDLKYIIYGVLVASLIILPWYLVHFLTYHNFYQHHFIEIGSRGKSLASYFNLNATQPLFYLHMGIRKWYYIWLAALTIIFIKRDFMKKEVFFLIIWNLLVLYPFLTTDQTHIWHLIPVYIPISLIIAYGFHSLFSSLSFRTNVRNLGVSFFLLSFILLATIQIKGFYAEVIPANKYIADDVAILKTAGNLHNELFLDDDFLPMAVFYTDKKVYPIRELEHYGIYGINHTLVDLFKSGRRDFAVITRSWAVNNLESEKIPYKISAKNNSFVIVTR